VTGCQRLGRTRLRGKTTPTLLHPRETQGCTVHVSCDDPPKRSLGVVKRLVPRSLYFAEPKTPRGIHASQEVYGTGNARGAGARDSIGWQTSVRRIARLHCRSIARSVGRSRALAGRKFVAPPDAEHEWRNGETVRMMRGSPQDSTNQGMQVSACTLEYDGRRSRAFAWRALTGTAYAGSFDSKVNVRSG
jgi:hypothetical protein